VVLILFQGEKMDGLKLLDKASKRMIISTFAKESRKLFKENPGLKSFGWDQQTEYGGRSCGTDFSVRNQDCLTYINGISVGVISDGYINKPKAGLREIAALHKEYASLTKKLERLKKVRDKPIKKDRLDELSSVFPTLTIQECDFAKNERAEKIKELETSIDEIMDYTGESLNCMFRVLLRQLAKDGNEKYQEYYDKNMKTNTERHLFRYTEEIFQELLKIWTETCQLTEIVEKTLAPIDPDLFQRMFGDGTRVTVTAKGITTKPNGEWDHENCCKSICKCS
jgi:hypothetical protein